MCGIFGYVGKRDAGKTIIEGLKRLEYRGYDSWGVAVVKKGEIDVVKQIGAIGDFKSLEKLPKSNIGIGHTRWATHGGVTNLNAHPHSASDKSFVVAQNGIVENYQDLKNILQDLGHAFNSQTDTEVIVRLIEEKFKYEHNLFEAVRKAFLDLEGRNTIIVLTTEGNHIIAVRNGSPLVIGMGKDEVFFASDTLSFADKTNKVIYINNLEMVEYIEGRVFLTNVKTGKKLNYQLATLDNKVGNITKDGFAHFMIKEIVEQKYTIKEATRYSEKELQPLLQAIKNAKNLYIIGAGTASFSAGQIAFFFRKIAHIHAIELKSYEIESFKELFSRDDVMLAISQSGETADTIDAIDCAKKKGVKIACLVNMLGSTITRISDFQYFSSSGPEVCVASTKAFTAQIAWGFLLAMSLINKYKEAKYIISILSKKLDKYFSDELYEQIKKLVRKIKNQEHFFVLGKGQNYYISLEGALKVKEITYKHFEGFAAGELKHGVIALIDKSTPVFAIVSDDENKKDMLSAVAQVKARGAFTIGIGKEKDVLFDEFISTLDGGLADSIINVIPFQLISYFLGVELGNNPDRPRNLAKSVTVK